MIPGEKFVSLMTKTTMNRFLIMAVAVVAVTFMTQADAKAQTYGGGYQFGAGLNAGCGFGCNRFQREQPPYFAKFPPVYYSHVVKRPYGVSPYAAPAGIAPVELNYVAPTPLSVKNPFFNREV